MIPILFAIVLNTIGIACLALSMERHYRGVYRADPGPNELPYWRRKSWPLLLLGLIVCLGGWGASIGIVVWTGLLSVALLIVAVYLAIRSRRK